jgi:hypothetical protein
MHGVKTKRDPVLGQLHGWLLPLQLPEDDPEGRRRGLAQRLDPVHEEGARPGVGAAPLRGFLCAGKPPMPQG